MFSALGQVEAPIKVPCNVWNRLAVSKQTLAVVFLQRPFSRDPNSMFSEDPCGGLFQRRDSQDPKTLFSKVVQSHCRGTEGSLTLRVEGAGKQGDPAIWNVLAKGDKS